MTIPNRNAFPGLLDVKFSEDSVSALAAVHRFLPEDGRERVGYSIFFGDDADKKRDMNGRRVFTWYKRAESTVKVCLENDFVWSDRILFQVIDRDFNMWFCAALLSKYEIGGENVGVPLSGEVIYKTGEKAAYFPFLDEMKKMGVNQYNSAEENPGSIDESFENNHGSLLRNMTSVLSFLGKNGIAKKCNTDHLFLFVNACTSAAAAAKRDGIKNIVYNDGILILFDGILGDQGFDKRLKLYSWSMLEEYLYSGGREYFELAREPTCYFK